MKAVSTPTVATTAATTTGERGVSDTVSPGRRRRPLYSPAVNAPASVVFDAAFSRAAVAFRRFFLELREAFLERDVLFEQIELALVCREHVLIIGPPGTAKSAIAGAVLGRLTDETTGKPSLFSKQLAENTVQTDLIGPIDFKVLTETGRTEYLTDEGMLGAVHAFLDEVFDGRDMLLRSILNVLHERELKHGRKVTPGLCECAVMTSNRYLSEVLQRSPETLQAFADRISFICFTPKDFAHESSRAQMLWRAQTGQRPALSERLTLQQLDVLQDAVAAVEVPAAVAEGLELLADTLEQELAAQVSRLPDYVPTTYFSQRSMVKALWALKAVVVRDRIYRRADRPLVAALEDLQELRRFFLLGGPPSEDVELLLKTAVDPRERAQLEILRVEHKAFEDAIGRVMPQLSQARQREATALQVQDDVVAAEGQARNWAPAAAGALAEELAAKLVPGPRHPENRGPLLAAAEALVGGLGVRLARGPQPRGTGRDGVVLLTSFADAFELTRRVPELRARAPELARQLAEYCTGASQMLALSAEATEFDDGLQLDALMDFIGGVVDEAGRLGDVLQQAAMVTPQVEPEGRAQLLEARARAAMALRRRAVRAFTRDRAATTGRASEKLSTDSRRLADLDRLLLELSVRHQPLRAELLEPLGIAHAAEVLGGVRFERLDELHRALQSLLENLRNEGVQVQVVLKAVRGVLDKRLSEYVQSRLEVPRTAPPSAPQVLSGEAYDIYRRAFSGGPVEGALQALNSLSALLQKEGDAPVAAAVREAVADAEVTALLSRARYLRGWLSQLLSALPQADALRSVAAADRVFDQLVKSRMPMLVTREGELLRLTSVVSRLAGDPEESEERGHNVRKAQVLVESVGADFMDYARRVLDARTTH